MFKFYCPIKATKFQPYNDNTFPKWLEIWAKCCNALPCVAQVGLIVFMTISKYLAVFDFRQFVLMFQQSVLVSALRKAII